GVKHGAGAPQCQRHGRGREPSAGDERGQETAPPRRAAHRGMPAAERHPDDLRDVRGAPRRARAGQRLHGQLIRHRHRLQLPDRHVVRPGHPVRAGLRGERAPHAGSVQAEGDAGAGPGEPADRRRCGRTPARSCCTWGRTRRSRRGAGTYIRWMIPALFFYGWLQCHVRFLQAQKLVVPVMLSSGATAVSHVLVCWALVYRLRLGIRGAALANAVSYLTNVSILAVYVRVSPSCNKSWTGFSFEAFHGLIPFLKLAVPSALMVCMEWWSFEVMVILSGLLPNPKLETAVLSICLNTNSLVCTVPNGLSSAISTRVSNELGAGRPRAALLAARVVIVLAFLVGTSEGLLLVLVHKVWGRAYSKDQEVVSYVATMMLILAVSVLFDGLQYVLSGIVRGCGQQKIGAFVNFIAYYLVGIPAALVFTFKCHLGGKGLWLGILSGLVTQTLLLLFISFGNTDWDKQAMNAKDRILTSPPVEP
ncbi:hypothetical protein CFC21_039000, partial [Triticum aestivum]